MLKYYYIFYAFLLCVGLGISSFLLYVYTSDSALPCTISHGCDTVRYSPYAKMFGLPIPLYGVAFYVVSLVLLALFLVIRQGVYLSVVWVLAMWGLVFAGYLTYLEAFVIHAWCSWCVLNAFVNVMMFGVGSYLIYREAKAKTVLGILVS